MLISARETRPRREILLLSAGFFVDHLTSRLTRPRNLERSFSLNYANALTHVLVLFASLPLSFSLSFFFIIHTNVDTVRIGPSRFPFYFFYFPSGILGRSFEVSWLIVHLHAKVSRGIPERHFGRDRFRNYCENVIALYNFVTNFDL